MRKLLTFLIALGAIVFAVVSPVSANGVLILAQRASGGGGGGCSQATAFLARNGGANAAATTTVIRLSADWSIPIRRLVDRFGRTSMCWA
jgi:hypothetical protein